MRGWWWLLPLCFVSRSADAFELGIEGTVGGAKTDWRGDAAAQAGLYLGLGITEHFDLCFVGRMGYGAAEDRLLSFISFGGRYYFLTEGPVRPHLRLSLAHQHEDPYEVLRQDWLGGLLGVSEGIWHRSGFEGALGLRISIGRYENIEVGWAAEFTVAPMFGGDGPSWYVGGTTGLALGFSL